MGWGVEDVYECVLPFFQIQNEVINVLVQFKNICLEIEIKNILGESHIL
jgi:hypothetical protein